MMKTWVRYTLIGAMRILITPCLLAVPLVGQPSANQSSAGTSTNAQGRPQMSVDLGNGQEMILVQITGGTFTMGSPSSEQRLNAERNEKEGPQHSVTITKSFWFGRTEVTQGQYQAVMGTNPSRFKKVGSEAPVENVSWADAQVFIRRLNTLAGSTVYRLPTEAEWEFACRAGSTGDRYGKLEAIAWCYSTAADTTHPVGQKQPNAWGLYDTLGNVSEWCQDQYRPYTSEPVTDPLGTLLKNFRVYRGGNWSQSPSWSRAASRFWANPDSLSGHCGFRILRTLP